MFVGDTITSDEQDTINALLTETNYQVNFLSPYIWQQRELNVDDSLWSPRDIKYTEQVFVKTFYSEYMALIHSLMTFFPSRT